MRRILIFLLLVAWLPLEYWFGTLGLLIGLIAGGSGIWLMFSKPTNATKRCVTTMITWFLAVISAQVSFFAFAIRVSASESEHAAPGWTQALIPTAVVAGVLLLISLVTMLWPQRNK